MTRLDVWIQWFFTTVNKEFTCMQFQASRCSKVPFLSVLRWWCCQVAPMQAQRLRATPRASWRVPVLSTINRVCAFTPVQVVSLKEELARRPKALVLITYQVLNNCNGCWFPSLCRFGQKIGYLETLILPRFCFNILMLAMVIRPIWTAIENQVIFLVQAPKEPLLMPLYFLSTCP